jgi:ribA/ribD-fused uncharacterized protein
MIKEFQKDFRWLSNFAPVDIRIGKRTFSSVEHAYMSMKSNDSAWKDFCVTEHNAGAVKRQSRKIQLIADWNDSWRLRIMEDLLRMKFQQEPYCSKLLATGNQNIQEGNRWNDKFFGVCLKTGIGENHLGRIIMKIREDLFHATIISSEVTDTPEARRQENE